MTAALTAAAHHDVTTLFKVLAVICVIVGVYFLVIREFIGAAVAIALAFFIVWLFT